MATATDVLITVMTYPQPSRGYTELICTAGITRQGEWVRLYPIDYRYQPYDRQFKKYQWVTLDLDAQGRGNDNRKESRRPHLDTLRVLGEPLPPGDWRERRAVIDALPVRSVLEWKDAYERDRTSLGVVRPTEVLDVTIEAVPPEFDPSRQAILDQLRLFGPQLKPLRKLPYKFSYTFMCEDSKSQHTAMIEDWELGVLFLRECERLGDNLSAARSVRHKYLERLCAPQRDVRFFMGTTFPWNSWVVLGVFWPPKVNQEPLFDYRASQDPSGS